MCSSCVGGGFFTVEPHNHAPLTQRALLRPGYKFRIALGSWLKVQRVSITRLYNERNLSPSPLAVLGGTPPTSTLPCLLTSGALPVVCLLGLARARAPRGAAAGGGSLVSSPRPESSADRLRRVGCSWLRVSDSLSSFRSKRDVHTHKAVYTNRNDTQTNDPSRFAQCR